MAISEAMRRRLEARGVDPGRISVIPGWVDTDEIHPVDVDRDGRFLVMHSGNVGQAQELDTLIEAAARLGDVDFEIVGNGARRKELERRAAGLANVSFRPYRPRAELSESLSSASLHFVGLRPGPVGLRRPEPPLRRARGGQARAGRRRRRRARPRSWRVNPAPGSSFRPGSPDEVAAAIRAARDGEYDLEEMGRRGRDYVVSRHGRDAGIAAYRELLEQVLGA